MSNLNGMPGPTSRIYFSQRLRLHYVDWGNRARRRCCSCMAGATIAATGTGWRGSSAGLAVSAPDLRGHGDSAWSPDGNYATAA